MISKLSTAVEKRITNDWASCFPDVCVYEPMHLLRRVGPLLIGVALERDSGNDCYLPTFHVHNLANGFGHITLTLAHPLRTNRTHAPETIPVRWHEERYREAASRLSSQIPLPLSGDVTLKQVLGAYENYIDEGRYEDLLFEDMALICSWAGEEAEAELIVAEARLAIERWPVAVRQDLGNLDDWEYGLLQRVRDTDSVRTTMQSEIVALQLGRIPARDLLLF